MAETREKIQKGLVHRFGQQSFIPPLIQTNSPF
jgi:hypothetical protein